MRFIKFIVLCFVFSIHYSFAQKTVPVTLSQNLNESGFVNLLPNTALYIDSTGNKSIQEADNQNFVSLKNFIFPPLSTNYYRYTFWLRLSVNNPTDSVIEVLFTTGVHKSVDVFRKIDDKYIPLQSTNQTLRPEQRPYEFDESYLPLVFEPRQSYELLVKVTEHPQIYFKLIPKITSYAAEYEDKIRAFDDEYIYFVHDGIYISILLFVATYMFIMFFIERKRYYLYYGFYLFFLVIFAFWAVEHSPYIQLIFSYLPVLKFSGNNNTYLLITNIFYYLFISEFLELPQIVPKFSRTLHIYIKVLIAILVVDTFINFILKDYSLGGTIWILTQPIIAIFGIYGTIQLYRLNGALVLYIQIGSTVLIIGAIIGFLEQLLLIKPDNNVLMRLAPSFGLNYAVLIEIFCFSIALAYKTWFSQRNRNQLFRSVKESELRTLRSQINPHFIFNSLNSIKAYILKDRQLEASEYLTDFSTLMRAILQQSKEKFITLSEELETTLLYVKLENLRFEDGFLFHFAIDENIDTHEVLIPPMLLQPYIENAIKHGLMNKNNDRILNLSISQTTKEEVLIAIDDNGIGREQAALQRKNTLKHQSMGMSINHERVHLLGITNDLHISIKIIDKKHPNGTSDGTRVEIYLPI